MKVFIKVIVGRTKDALMTTKEKQPRTNRVNGLTKEFVGRTKDALMTNKEKKPRANRIKGCTKEFVGRTNEIKARTKEFVTRRKGKMPCSGSGNRRRQSELPGFAPAPRRAKGEDTRTRARATDSALGIGALGAMHPRQHRFSKQNRCHEASQSVPPAGVPVQAPKRRWHGHGV